jgi:hypothetical protein
MYFLISSLLILFYIYFLNLRLEDGREEEKRRKEEKKKRRKGIIEITICTPSPLH